MKKLLVWMLILMLTLTACAETLSGWELRAEDISVTVGEEDYPLDMTPVLWGAKEEGRFTGGFRIELGDRILMPAQADLTEEGMGIRLKESAKYLLTDAGELPALFAALNDLPLSREKLWTMADTLAGELKALNLAPDGTTTLPMADVLARLDEVLPGQEMLSCVSLARVLFSSDFVGDESIPTDSLTALGEALGMTGDVEIRRNAIVTTHAEYIVTLKDLDLEVTVDIPVTGKANPPEESPVGEALEDVEATLGVIGGADGPTSIFVTGQNALAVRVRPLSEDLLNGGNFIIAAIDEGGANLELLAQEREEHGESQTDTIVCLLLDENDKFVFGMNVNCEQEEVKPYSSPYHESLTIQGAPADDGMEADVSYLLDSEFNGSLGVTFRATLAPADVEDGMANARVVNIAYEDDYSVYDTGLQMATLGWMGDFEVIMNADSFLALGDALTARERAAWEAYEASQPEEEKLTIEDFPKYTLPDGFQLVSEEIEEDNDYIAQWQDAAGNIIEVEIYSISYEDDGFDYSVSSSDATATFYALDFHFKFSAPRDVLTYDVAEAIWNSVAK